jgi:hypothetical protein
MCEREVERGTEGEKRERRKRESEREMLCVCCVDICSD